MALSRRTKIYSVVFISIFAAFFFQYILFPGSFPFNIFEDQFYGEGRSRSRRRRGHIRIAIIGGGLSGTTSALTASQNNLNEIVLFEKESRIGGNSQKATSGINGVNTNAQKSKNIKDSIATFLDDTIKSGKGKSEMKLVEKLVKKSTSAISFLSSFGVDLSTISQLGGHTYPRTHRSDVKKAKMNIGTDIMNSLIKAIRQYSTIEVKTGCKVINIRKVGESYLVKFEETFDDKKVKIVQRIFDAVVITTGGFSSNSKMVKMADSKYEHFPTTNGEFATGDGIKLGENLSAKIVDLNYIQVHPTGLVNPKTPDEKKVFIAPEALRGEGGILINGKGQRFVDELTTRDRVTKSILKNCLPFGGTKRNTCILLLNEKVVKNFGEKLIRFYRFKGLVKDYTNSQEFCTNEKLDCKNVKDTLKEYSGAKTDKFGKRVIRVKFSVDEKLYVLYVTPAIHYTMGGLLINDESQVLDQDGKIIPNLYAAGEVTGGIHGLNRLGGNSLLEGVVFGRIAGGHFI